jgi:HAD superfamily hydrolase (TIGR01484 family)
MLPLHALPRERLARIRGVFADVDDTLTTEGYLTAEAYGAMEQLRDAGLLLIPVTGRPAGWCDHIARMWPVDAVVGENGAFWYRYLRAERRMERRYLADAASRARQRAQLEDIGKRIVAGVPGSALASDQAFRVADLAIDFCEDVPRLTQDSVNRIVAMMGSEGLHAKVSSIHVNGWFGNHDKLTTTRLMMRESFSVSLDQCLEDYVFVGDSPNDQPMFAFFPYSIGVANIRDFDGQLTHPPSFVAQHRAGAGFAEVAHLLLDTFGRTAATTV